MRLRSDKITSFCYYLTKKNTENSMTFTHKMVPIIIIGGGPVGLSMALALARQNVHTLVIEQHSGRDQHPRARGVSMRSMELFKQWGNIDELLKYEFPRETVRFIWTESLQGNEITRVAIKDTEHNQHIHTAASFVTQDCVEEYLLHTLKQHPEAAIQFSTTMIDFKEDDDGVLVRVFNRKTNKEELIRAKYLIAADGAHSSIRKQLGIAMQGPDNLGRFCNVYCEFDVAKWTDHRRCIGFFFIDPRFSNRTLLIAYGKNRWIMGMRFTPEDTKETYTDDYCLQEIRRVLEIPDLKIKLIDKSFWMMAAQIAQAYRKGKVLLVGDAAHRLPPTGGLGMNTGIQDVNNLAWKLAFVLNYQVSDALLDTYYDERAPVAHRNIEWSRGNAQRFIDIDQALKAGDYDKFKMKLHEQQQHLNFVGLDLGYIYHSKAVLSENEQTISVSPAHYVPTTLPGALAPYMTFIKNNKKVTTLELFEKSYVLMVGQAGQDWQLAVNELAKTLPYPLICYRVATDGDLSDPKNLWPDHYEVTAGGAVLVRPDGFVAWRSKEMVADPTKTLSDVLKVLNPIVIPA